MIKSIIYFILIALSRVLLFPISLIFFPLAYPFRHKSHLYCLWNGPKGLHILQIINWFFTKEGVNGDWWIGPYWYKKEFKDKYFSQSKDLAKTDFIPNGVKENILYFYLAYRWGAIRNYMWNLNRLLNYEGWRLDRPELIHDTISPRFTGSNLNPQCKFIDKEGFYRDNSGPYILYPFNKFQEDQCSIEGARIWKFYTPKSGRNPRFYYCYCKIVKLSFIKRYLAIEIKLGWFPDWGSYTWQTKFMLKKADMIADFNYDRYKKVLS